MSTVTISLLTHTALSAARRCIASVMQHSTDYDLILTANGNPEAADYFSQLAQTFQHVRVVVNETNEGFIKPNVHALSLTETPLLVLLNDDTLVCRDWLEMLRFPFHQYPMAALSGPVARCTCLTPQMRGIPGYALEYLEGSCLMARTSLMKEHGLFDPALQFAYGEDSDLSLRMRQAGYTIHQAPFRLPLHVGGATTRKVKQAAVLGRQNLEYLAKKWADYLATSDRLFPHERT